MVKDLGKVITTAIHDWGDNKKITFESAFLEMESSINDAIDTWYKDCESIFNGKTSHKLHHFKESIKEVVKTFISLLKYQSPIRDKYKPPSFVRHAYEGQLDNALDKVLERAHDLTEYARLIQRLEKMEGHSKLHEVKMSGPFSTN